MASAFRAFIKIGDIKGESTDAGHKEWSEVDNFEFSFHLPSQPGSTASGGALVYGDVIFSGLHLTKKLEKSSPELFFACCKGKSFPEVTIERLKKLGSDQMTKVYSIKLTNAVINYYEPLEETEKIAFNCSKVEYVVVSTGPDNKTKGTVTHTWDFTTNTGT